ncbi:Protein of unknown function [Arthrobacter sp. ok362]|nr:Protein of unknown function [Arthrobacter sp. ok362]
MGEWRSTPPLVRTARYIGIELKTGKFSTEYAGKLNFYVAFVFDVLRQANDQDHGPASRIAPATGSPPHPR